MRVKMLTATYWNGKRLKAGDIADVSDDTGARRAKAGIAEKQTSKPPAKKTDKE